MSWLDPSALQHEEDLSVWDLPADVQHLEENSSIFSYKEYINM